MEEQQKKELENPRQKPENRLTISIITTSFYTSTDAIEKAAVFFEESGFNVRVKTRGIDSKEEFDKHDLPPVFQKIKKKYFESRPSSTEEEQEATQKDFERDYLNYSSAFTEMKKKDGKSINVEDERLHNLGNNEFEPLKEYLNDSYKKSQILKEEVEAASRGEVDVIWPVDGGSGAPEMLKFLPDKLPENPAVIVGMSDVTAVQNALIQSSNHTMKGIQEFGSRVFGDEGFTRPNKRRVEQLYSTIEKARNGEDVDTEYTLTAGDKNKNPTKPQLVNLSGGTLNVLNRASDTPYELSKDKNSDTVIVEMHGQAQRLAGSISEKIEGQEKDSFNKIFGNKKNIILGNVLFDKQSDEFQKFTDRVAEDGINIYEGLPFGHGGSKLQRKPIPLNVPSVLLPGSSKQEAKLLINPSKERLQEKLEEIGYKQTPAKFVESLNNNPEQAREFIMSEPDVAAVMIKYSGLEPKDIFRQAGLDERMQKHITEKIAQGAKEPNQKKNSSAKFPLDPIVNEKNLIQGRENLKQIPEELMKVAPKQKQELSKISQTLKNGNMESASKDFENDGPKVKAESSLPQLDKSNGRAEL